MLIFKRKTCHTLQDVLYAAIRYNKVRLSNSDPDDREILQSITTKWEKILHTVEKFVADPVPLSIYTVVSESFSEYTDASNTWACTYRSLEAAQKDVMEECVRIREEEEQNICLALLPGWESDGYHRWVLEDHATGRTWTICRTILK